MIKLSRLGFLAKALLAGISLCWLSAGLRAEIESQKTSGKTVKKPHVLFIMLDDMGYGDTGCYNPQSKIPTPNIDRLAKAGMRFTDAHAPGALCVPSRYGFLTGRYPSRVGGYQIRSGTQTIASFLKRHSYNTGMVGKWHNGFDKIDGWKGKLKGGPNGCGFDYFFGIPHSLDIQPYLYIENNHVVQPPTKTTVEGKVATAGIYNSKGWNKIQGAFWRSGKIAPDFKHAEVLGKFTKKAISFLRDHKKTQAQKPFFLYLAYAGPHTPWLPSDKFKGKSGAGLYGDFLMEIDHEIGNVIEALEGNGFKENTLIMLSSDNGPVWYPSNTKEYQHSSVGPLRGMKADAFEGGHRMPFIASWPGKIPAGTLCHQTICLTDMMRTLAAIVGEKLPEGVGIDSYNILPLLLGEQTGPVRDLTIHKSRFLAIRKGKYKFLDGKGSGGFSRVKKVPGAPPGQLYDLEKDLGETKNLYRQHPEVVKKLKALLNEYRK